MLTTSGSWQDGKINVKFSPQGDNPSFLIENSYKITDKKQQQETLEYIMASDYYSQDVYCRTIDSMMIEWQAHNDLNKIKHHYRLASTDFDKNDEKMGYWDYWDRAAMEVLGI